MKRLFALLGFSTLLACTTAVFLGWFVSLWCCVGCLVATGVLAVLLHSKNVKLPLVVCLTMALTFGSYSSTAQREEQAANALADQKVELTGTLCDLPYEQGKNHVYLLAVGGITNLDGTPYGGALPKSVRMTSQNPLDMQPYDTFTGKVQLFLPSDTDLFSYRHSLSADGVTLQGLLYEYEGYTIEAPSSKPLSYWLLTAKEQLLKGFATVLPPQESSLLSASVLGDRHTLSDQVKNQFIRSGVYHLLVVSGLHLSVVAMAVLFLLRRLSLPRGVQVVVTAFVVLLFMALTGFTASVLRSGIMMLLLLGGMLLHRKSDPLNGLGVAVFCMTLWNPLIGGDTGFLLSVMATLGMVLAVPRCKTAANRLLPQWSHGSRGKRLLWRMCKGIAETLCVTLGVTLFTTPVLILTGREISLIAPLTNLLLLPFVTLMLVTGLLTAVCSLLPFLAFITYPMGLVAGLCAKLMLWVTKLCASIPFASVPSAYEFVSMWLVLSLFLLAVVLVAFRSTRHLASSLFLILCMLFAGIGSHVVLSGNTLALAVLDVGDGLSVVLTYNGHAAILGCSGYSSQPLLQYLQQEQIRQIDYLQPLAYTGEERKHCIDLLQQYPTQMVAWEAAQYLPQDMATFMAEKGITLEPLKTPATITTLNNATLQVSPAFAETGLLCTLYDTTFFLQQDGVLAPKQADLCIASGMPNGEADYLTTLLSVDDTTLATQKLLPQQAESLGVVYSTAGQGHLRLEVAPNHVITLERGM